MNSRLEWLEKHEPGALPDGYCLSLAYTCLIDCTRSIFTGIDSSKGKEGLQRQLLLASDAPLLTGLSLLLECSVDEAISESLLNCFSTLVLLASGLGVGEAKEASLKALCRASLPTGYFDKYVEPSLPHPTAPSGPTQPTAAIEATGREKAELSQVVAMGCPCPTPALPAPTATVVLVARNMQAAKVLITSSQANGQQLTQCWDVVAASLQHLVWILGMRPTSTGSFRAGGELVSAKDSGGAAGGAQGASANTTILTTALSGELPELDAALSRLFEQTANYDDVALHHVIAGLCRLSSEAMQVAQATVKEPSFFSVAKLLQTAVVNLHRLAVFWWVGLRF